MWGSAAGELRALMSGERSERLMAVNEQLTAIESGARVLLDVAREDDFPDVAREADSLKRRVAALRKKLSGAVPAQAVTFGRTFAEGTAGY